MQVEICKDVSCSGDFAMLRNKWTLYAMVQGGLDSI